MSNPKFQNASISINERIDLSSNYQTFAFNITYNDGQEISTLLVNYTLKNEIIDFIEASYYEFITEETFIDSQLEKNQITVTNVSRLDDLEEKEITIYSITEKGEIEKNR